MENFKSTEALLSWIVDYIFIPFGSKKMRKCAEGLTENSFSELVPLLDAVELAGLSSGRGQLFCAEVHAGGLF
jgi:hypothetical protein